MEAARPGQGLHAPTAWHDDHEDHQEHKEGTQRKLFGFVFSFVIFVSFVALVPEAVGPCAACITRGAERGA
jgi:hypothetical protein